MRNKMALAAVTWVMLVGLPASGDSVKTVESNGVKVTLHMSPAKPVLKSKTEVVFTFTDAQTRKHAMINKMTVRWAMTEHGHDVSNTALMAAGDGDFHTTMEFPMMGAYAAIVTAEYEGTVIIATFPFNVK